MNDHVAYSAPVGGTGPRVPESEPDERAVLIANIAADALSPGDSDGRAHGLGIKYAARGFGADAARILVEMTDGARYAMRVEPALPAPEPPSGGES